MLAFKIGKMAAIDKFINEGLSLVNTVQIKVLSNREGGGGGGGEGGVQQ